MHRIYIFFITLTLFLVSFGYGQTITYDFEVSDGSYDNTDYGDWYAANSMTYGSGKQHAGSKALVFDDDAGAYLLYQGSDNNGKDNGLGSVSFYYRHWDGDGSTVKFKVQYNKSSAGWVDIGTEVSVSSVSYIQFTANVNLSGDDILFRILSTAYSERLLIDDIELTDFGATNSTFTISDDGLINEGNENSELITISLQTDTFVSTLNISNWSVNNLPSGVSYGTLNRINDSTATILLSGNRDVDYDTDILNLTITIDHSELVHLSSGSISASSGVQFTASDDTESITISDDGNIEEGIENNETINVVLSGGTFTNPLNSSQWTINSGPTGVSIGTVTRISDTLASITLSGNATVDYDINIIDAEIRINYSQIDDLSAGELTTNTGIIFKANIEPKPTIQATNIVFTSIGATQLTANWTRGNGEKCILVVSEDVSVNEYPIDTIDYTASTIFGNGEDLGNSNFVVYKGSGNSSTITGLTQGKTYYFRLFEYNNNNQNTRYDTSSSTGNPAFTSTKPNDVTNFQLDCISKSTAYLSWTMPAGAYSGVIIAARESTNPVHVISSGPGTSYTANSIFGAGTAFGSTSPNSFVVYNGNSNSVAISGLTPGANYTFKAYVYLDSLWSSGTSKSAQKAEIKEVTSLMHYAPNQEIVLNWENPNFNCPDEVMVVMKSGSGITNIPSGNGSSYTSSSIFGNGTDLGSGEYVVYKGQQDGVTISGLTNGTPYYFTIYVRDDTTWSDGVSDFNTPNDITILFASDLAVLSVNTNTSSGGDDEISFVCFDTLKTGTAIDFTDNGWERSFDGYWGSSEGVIRITRTGVDVLPGEVVTIRGQGYQPTDFTVIGLTDNDWTVSSLNGNSSFNLNSTDQLWIMQYGTWTNGSVLHQASYSGNILYGWTATGWAGDVGHGSIGSTSYSALYPFGECFNTNVVNTTEKDRVKYTGIFTSATQRNWIARINNPINWTGYSTTALFNSEDTIYSTGLKLAITQSNFSEGQWIGDVDSNWFNCANWSNLTVPNTNTDVKIDSAATRICVISHLADFSDDFNDTATCQSLSIHDSTLFFYQDSPILVTDDVNIFGGKLILNGSTIELQGDWTNNTLTSFEGSNGILRFSGSTNQTISNTATVEQIDQLIVDNQYNLKMASDIEINHLDFVQGKIFVEDNLLKINDSITNYSENSYIVFSDDTLSTGKLLLNVGTTKIYYPIGNTDSYTPISASISTGNAVFGARVFSSLYDYGTSGAKINGDIVTKTWIIEPTIPGAYTAQIKLTWNLAQESSGFSLDKSTAGMIYNDLTKSSIGWTNWSIITGGGPVTGVNPFSFEANNITTFGAFGISSKCTIRKPITSKIYHF